MPQPNILLPSGTLWDKVIKQTKHALKCEALQSIPTTYERVEQDGVAFIVRMLVNLSRKEEARKQQDVISAQSGKEFNPFLPYEKDLFVADLTETHLCLLNKFNAVDYHLLIITRAFEDQEKLLTLEDFVATWICLDEIDGLVFYNAGQKAGASQRHKHLQLIPLPLVPGESPIPIAPLLKSAHFEGIIGTVAAFPFQHSIAYFSDPTSDSLLHRAEIALELYQTLLDAVGLQSTPDTPAGCQADAYNLLMTREWMMLIPRSQERFEGIPVNSLGFAGALLVRNEQQMQFLKQVRPMAVLKGVALPSNYSL